MTKVKCRQGQCANWHAGVCGVEDIDVDEHGICLTQDEETREILDALSPVQCSWVGVSSFMVDPDMEDDDWDDDDLLQGNQQLDDDEEDWDDDAYPEDDLPCSV